MGPAAEGLPSSRKRASERNSSQMPGLLETIRRMPLPTRCQKRAFSSDILAGSRRPFSSRNIVRIQYPAQARIEDVDYFPRPFRILSTESLLFSVKEIILGIDNKLSETVVQF
jgi:hypothetical protein